VKGVTKHVRTLWLCLATGLIMSGITLALTAPAMANPLPNPFLVFKKSCPTEHIPITQCEFGKTEEDSAFKAGNINVPLEKPLIIQGGSIFNEETEKFTFVEPKNGLESIPAVRELVPGGLAAILNPAKLNAYEHRLYERNQELGPAYKNVYVTVELAQSPEDIILNEEHLLLSEGTAIGVAVKVHLTNPLLGKTCNIGSEEKPIAVNLTTGKSGALTGAVGNLEVVEGGALVYIRNNELIDNEYEAPAATGCGTDNNPVDRQSLTEALNQRSGLPSGKGFNVVKLKGTLYVSAASTTAEKLKEEFE